jgi:hypothetical protein
MSAPPDCGPDAHVAPNVAGSPGGPNQFGQQEQDNIGYFDGRFVYKCVSNTVPPPPR